MASRNIFCFKQFAVNQDECAMKVSTDGVLLAAWCRVGDIVPQAILDIGTGTGLMALQLAQRNTGTIDAVEIDLTACAVAQQNFDNSPWADRLTLYATAIQDFRPQKLYDHIVSNPPWFIDSLTSPNNKRNIARHSVSLNYGDLLKCCIRLISHGGRLSVILPAGAETERFIIEAAAHGFWLSRRTEVHSTPKSGPKRTLMEFSRHQTPIAYTTMVIGDDEYRALTREFYLYY